MLKLKILFNLCLKSYILQLKIGATMEAVRNFSFLLYLSSKISVSVVFYIIAYLSASL